MNVDPSEIAKIIQNLINENNKSISRMFKRGVVSSIAGQYANIYVEGNTVETKNVPSIGTHAPVVGEKVLMMSIGDTGANLVILGPIFASSPNSRTITTATTLVPLPPLHMVTALASALSISTPGAAANGAKIMIRIKDNGTSRGLTWNAIFRPIGVSLPSSTIAGKQLYVGAIYNQEDSKWDVIAVTQET
jgi:hypothetical protein